MQHTMPDSSSSLRAEADGNLRVGARSTATRQLGFHWIAGWTKPRGDEQLLQVSKETGSKGFSF